MMISRLSRARSSGLFPSRKQVGVRKCHWSSCLPPPQPGHGCSFAGKRLTIPSSSSIHCQYSDHGLSAQQDFCLAGDQGVKSVRRQKDHQQDKQRMEEEYEEGKLVQNGNDQQGSQREEELISAQEEASLIQCHQQTGFVLQLAQLLFVKAPDS